MTKTNDTQKTIADIQDEVSIKLERVRSIIAALVAAEVPGEPFLYRLDHNSLMGCLHTIDDLVDSARDLIDIDLNQAKSQAA